MEHEAVAEAGVIGVPDPVAGEVVKAFVELRPGWEPSEQLQLDIIGFARKRLGPAVAPRLLEFTAALPQTRSGKILRRLLKARELGLPEGDTSTIETPPGAAPGTPPDGPAGDSGRPGMTGPLAAPPARLDPAHGRHLLLQMLRVRRLEEKCVELYSAAKIRGFLHVYIGEEAVAAGVLETLAPEDAVVATYREHGHALLRGRAGRGDPRRDVRLRARAAAAAAAAPCISSTPPPASTAATRSSPGACRSPSAWRSRTRWPGVPASPCASSARAPSRRASSTKASTSPRCGSCPCCSAARTTSTRWARRWAAPNRRPTSR